MWEGTTLAKGYHRDGFGHEWAEINGSEGSAVYRLHEPNTILLGKTGQDLAPVPVPAEFLKPAGSPRDPDARCAGDRVPLRPDVGVHLGDRRRAPGRSQLLRRLERPDRRRCRAAIARRAEVGRYAARKEVKPICPCRARSKLRARERGRRTKLPPRPLGLFHRFARSATVSRASPSRHPRHHATARPWRGGW